ncbi:tripartite tricarboxylate transporter substrate binding protein [Lacisediminimonas sp.]|uniref:Bug family tripartite tricarboxylate transporter substrate binding protein n=1 Tax=Lacisediminimonas sp. TaxID=3060582 RepID=UPI0027163D3C|nr:tripartite tricarboxylate transporter substrate binding protein [Lacisediminimonas sp.]MDO8299717.1 tripartite tricarboxylate transporter substrate binding protein [Lacisediminimonas sp.]MDO9217859.1 tripartite tricarboxylate transporter substrate binding protein [Lacisediminimonas sp.]
MRKSLFVRSFLVTLVMAAAPAAFAQTADFPNKPIKIVAPFPPGGATDLYARAVGDTLTKAWGQPVVVDNKPGASGMIGAELASRMPPDGYSLLIGAASLHTILPLLNENMGKTQANLTPVTTVGINPSYVVVPATLPINTIQELVAMLKAAPGKHGYASAGPGTSQHVFVELFKQATGTDMFHVPYKGSAPMVTDLIAGRVLMGIEQGPAVLQHIKSGRLKALAVTTPKRAVALPDVPTVAETVSPGFDASTWFAVYAPAGTPAEILNKLSAEIGKGFQTPEIRARLLGAGVEPDTSTPAALKQRELRDTEKWGRLIKSANISLSN